MRALLFGHPVAHSLSPVMHNAAFTAMGLDDVYEAVDVEPARLEQTMAELRHGAFLGAQLTVPHKLAAAALMDELSPDAALLGAVNTVVIDGDTLSGHNCDVEGALLGLFGALPHSPAGARVVFLGAGGGARAALLALARSDRVVAGQVVVAARRIEAGAELVALAAEVGMSATAAPWPAGGEVAGADVIVNCTPVGLYGDDDPIATQPLTGKIVLDLAYQPGGTPLTRRAEAEGAVAIQGDRMLLYQAAAAIRLWTGHEPPIDVMSAALAAALAA